MTILDAFRKRAEGVILNLGIGLGESASHNLKILNATLELVKSNPSTFFLFGNKKQIEFIAKNSLYKEFKNSLTLIDSENPNVVTHK